MTRRKVTVMCPHCKLSFDVMLTRQNAKGEGAHYAKEMTDLADIHRTILQQAKLINAHSIETGVTAERLFHEVREALQRRGEHWPGDHAFSGRMSELVGHGDLKSDVVRIELKDPATMQFRPRSEIVYWLSEKRQDTSLASYYGV